MTGDRATLKALGRRIRAARTTIGMSQGQLAAEMGGTAGQLHGWEAGARDPGVGGLKALADALGVTAGWLLGEDRP